MSDKEFRLRLTKDENDIIQAWRERGNLPELLEQCKAVGIPLKDVKHYWHKSEKFSIFAKNDAFSLEDLFTPILEQLQSYSPTFTPILRQPVKDPHCLIIDPADVHVGKYSSISETGAQYDIDKAVSQVHDGIEGILSKAFGFNIDKVIFVIGNDCLHIDTPKRQTTSGTPQDTCGMWHEAFVAAKEMYIRAIERILPYSNVEVIFNPSNHDYMSGFMLAQTIEAYFRNSANVKFDVSIRHRKYTRYGNNMIATSHGDGAKLDQTPLLMATENPQMWNDCHYRYIYLHHIHHKQTHKFMSGKDFIGVTAEYLRSPSYSDAWHEKSGYVGAKKAIEGFVHSFQYGQVARLTHHV
tara:strand:+ start:26 stop:1084 length:1059 start_codon:yes stop_codon:yes gene_type:complete